MTVLGRRGSYAKMIGNYVGTSEAAGNPAIILNYVEMSETAGNPAMILNYVETMEM